MLQSFHKLWEHFHNWPATTHAHRPYHTSQVLWPHCTCWSIHGSWALRSSVVPLPRDSKHRSGRPCQSWPYTTVESDVAPLNIVLANCLSLSTKSEGMEVSRGNSDIHWTVHMMMIISTTEYLKPIFVTEWIPVFTVLAIDIVCKVLIWIVAAVLYIMFFSFGSAKCSVVFINVFETVLKALLD